MPSPRRNRCRWPAALLLAAALAGCSRGEDGATRVLVIGDQPPVLGTAGSEPANEASAVLRGAIAQGLVRFDEAGQIDPGLAERWNVSDDGSSFIFRLATQNWPTGEKITARDVARMLNAMRQARPGQATRDAIGAIDEVVPMTDRVIEIRLTAPRPNLLALLAEPDFALIRDGEGTGPFALVPARSKPGGPLLLRHTEPGRDGDDSAAEEVSLGVAPAAPAIARFAAGEVDLVLGGTVDDLPLATAAKLARGTLRFDPVAGLFGLVPGRRDGPAADPRLRRILSQAIDRDALVRSLGVPGLSGRATLLQGGLYAMPDPTQPPWLAQPLDQRRAALIAAAHAVRPAPKPGPKTKPTAGNAPLIAPEPLTLALPATPGGDLLLARLRADWGPLGFAVDRAAPGRPADFTLVDKVAPSDSAAWFLRQFRCDWTPVCEPKADPLLDAARGTQVPLQRTLLLVQAAQMMDEAQLFIPLAAPVRWSLVARTLPGFQENRYARHPLAGLKDRPGASN
ncbi:ABC transporter substrate-binding protein [Sphingomonas sp. ASV193]|uniref:ABC transporter substrate-binding protein n=1 Tax=Sphingomonas sp. ASV193 TaxID=3144405 RepID=UPI0032E8786F